MRYAADAGQLQRLPDGVTEAHGGFQMCPPPGWPALGSIREPRGIDVLWGAGVPPELVLEVQDRVLPADVAAAGRELAGPTASRFVHVDRELPLEVECMVTGDWPATRVECLLDS